MVVMYEQPKDIEGFEKHYFNVHIPLGKKIPHIKNESVRRVIQSQNTSLNLYLITEVEFESMDKLNQALQSNEARVAEEDGVNLIKFLIIHPLSPLLNRK